MRIQHNIMAMNAYRNYNTNTSALSKNLEKLSSGYKINRAGDDAAGLAISEKMRAQITGLNAAQKNVKDGISMVKTAEGAMQEIQDMLNRMDYLATQSANGTYDNEVDRKNLQKEVDALKSEINRIADSSNFNGIKLLDGSMDAANGITTQTSVSNVAAVLSDKIGNQSKAVDGKLTPGDDGAKYQASFYFGEITNTDAADKTIEFDYKDADGNAKKVTLTIEAGKTATTENIAKALSTGAPDGGVKTVGDSGSALAKKTGDTVAEKGKFNELYDVRADGNILVITAKKKPTEEFDGGKGSLAAGKVGAVTITNNLANGDIANAQKKLEEDWGADGTDNKIVFGGAAKEPTAEAAPTDPIYRVASEELDLTSFTDLKTLHNVGLKIGSKTYVFQVDGEDLKGTAGATVIKLKTGTGNDNATSAAQKLAAQITADESTNGNYVAKANAGKLVVSESTNYGKAVLEGNKEPGKGVDVIQDVQFTKSAASTALNGSITIDKSVLSNGTTVTMGGKTFVLTSDDKTEVTSGQVKVSYGVNASDDEIATALAKAMTDAGFSTVTASGSTVTLSGVANVSSITTGGPGRKLQIGDTSESYNQLAVKVKDMHTNAMGTEGGLTIADVDISTQEGAAAAIQTVKDAINYVSGVRGDLGAIQNRLEHTQKNLSVMAENIQDAESTIRDTDVAEEMMSYVKNNILVQSAQAMLAQANQVPQGVLQLLG